MFLILLIAAGLFVLLSIIMYLSQDKLVYHPSKQFNISPDDAGLQYQDLMIPVTSGELIHAWYFKTDSTAPTILFSHGNAGNVSNRLETVDLFVKLGMNVLVYDYRGYGKSSGKPSEKNTYADVAAAYNWLIAREGVKSDKLVLFGRSLGAAVGIELASRLPVGGVIIESSFTSLADIGKRLYPYIPVSLLLRYTYDSKSRMAAINRPVMVIHSQEDDLIPFEMGKELFAVANQPKEFLEISGGHNDREYLEHPQYQKRLRQFILGAAGVESDDSGDL